MGYRHTINHENSSAMQNNVKQLLSMPKHSTLDMGGQNAAIQHLRMQVLTYSEILLEGRGCCVWVEIVIRYWACQPGLGGTVHRAVQARVGAQCGAGVSTAAGTIIDMDQLFILLHQELFPRHA